MTSLHKLYRATLRQFAANSIHERTKRSPSIPRHLRLMFDGAKTLEPSSAQFNAFERQVDDMVVFLKAHRLHKELVERYNPTHGMTDDERARRSANMVGLQFPDENKQPRKSDGEATEADDGKPKGTLQTMRVRTPFHGE
ncbi:hypothetical protein ACM66B_000166 [Microbotryomycetes sp. NB124-2]